MSHDGVVPPVFAPLRITYVVVLSLFSRLDTAYLDAPIFTLYTTL